MSQRKPNPMHLALWAIAGGVIALSAWAVLLLPLPSFHSDGCGFWMTLWRNRLRLLAFAGPILIGFPISIEAEKRFNKGFRDELWSEAELAPVLSLASNPLWAWGTVAVFVAYMLFVMSREHLGGGGFLYILIYPLSVITRMRQLLTPRPEGHGVLWHLQNLKPIQSEHWGEPVAHTENPPDRTS